MLIPENNRSTDEKFYRQMKVLEIRFQEQTILVPAEPVTPILIYQRYGNYYIDGEGWQLMPSQGMIPKEKFNYTMEIGDSVQVSVKEIDGHLASRLMENDVNSKGYFDITDRDVDEMLAQCRALKSFLTAEGLLH